MKGRRLRARIPRARANRRDKFARAPKAQGPASSPRLLRADRKSLLLGTALASTLIIGSLLAPTPASAVQTCLLNIIPFVPINYAVPPEAEPINCLNFLPRTGVLGFDAIALATTGANNTINLTNLATGILVSTGLEVEGIFTRTAGANSSITIDNRAAVATAGIQAEGIYAFSTGAGSGINIVNSGPIATVGLDAEGIYARTVSAGSSIIIVNSGPIATVGGSAGGIFAISAGSINNNSGITLVNSGPIATAGSFSPLRRRYSCLRRAQRLRSCRSWLRRGEPAVQHVRHPGRRLRHLSQGRIVRRHAVQGRLPRP